MINIKQRIEQINEQMGYFFDKELGLTRSNLADELRSISIISNIENKSYDSSFSKEEIQEFEKTSNFIDKKEFQLFGDDVHKILELVYEDSETKDSICEKMTSIQAKIDFENLYNSLLANMDSMCKKLNLDQQKFFSELKVTDGFNHGKFDLVVQTNDGKNIIIDYKTSYNISINYKLQINMYKLILEKYYDIKIDGSYLVKIDKETYNFTLVEVEDIDRMYINPLLETGILNEDDVLACINKYVTSDDEKNIVITVDIESKNMSIVDEVISYQQKIEFLKEQAKEKMAEYKNIKKEEDDLNVLIQNRVNELLEHIDFDQIGDEYKIENTNLSIIKKDKANGNSPKFIEQYNTKEAIIEFCKENANDFFNNITDLRSLKSYMWKNYDELHTPKWVLNVKVETEIED